MSVLYPSFGIIAAVRADIVTMLKGGGSAEDLAKGLAPLLAIVNQWSTQIPLLLSMDNSGSCTDLVFAIRKDLFQGPLHSQATFGTPVIDLPDPFQHFIHFTRDIISAQKAEKGSQKVRFLVLFICLVLTFDFSPLNVLEKSSLSLLSMKRNLRLKL